MLCRCAFPVASELREALTSCLFEAGAEGLMEEAGALVTYVPEGQEARLLLAYEEFRSVVQVAMPEFGVEPAEISLVEENYHERWLAELGPVEVLPDLYLCPVGKEGEVPAGAKLLPFEPTASFGSGGHPTTRLACEAMALWFSQVKPQAARVLDVGTGCGVLALVALHLGAASAVGTDIDPVSVESAQHNAELCGLGARLTSVLGSFPEGSEQFPLVLANIDVKTLCSLSAELCQRTAPGGRLLLTGLLTTDVLEVESAFRAHGFTRQALTERSDWALLALERA